VIFTGVACQTTETDGPTHAEKVVAEQKAEADKPAKQKADKPAEPAAAEDVADEPAEPEYTTAQEQAIGSASDYLDYSAFSRKGLIDQLKYEDFSVKDATFAVDHIKVDWNEQAAASAKDYLDYGSFSRQGLIEQLEYEGFTTAQATYGVNQTGL
jgi:colicin import membrane protein